MIPFSIDDEDAIPWQGGLNVAAWTKESRNSADFCATASAIRQMGGRLVALWGSTTPHKEAMPCLILEVLLALPCGYLRLQLPLDHPDTPAPDLSGLFSSAHRLQRATHDLMGIHFDAQDQRPWLRHGGWPAHHYPLGTETALFPPQDNQVTDYAFVSVGGRGGAHEIPVGPVHAGIIEPGHFRFSVAGERVLRLEQRLGYVHRGVEKLFSGKVIAWGAQLAGRLCGDSTCAYAWAYAMAVEAAIGFSPPARALALRAILLERERIANHLGDLGALGNDAGLAFGLSQFMRLKEDWLRLHQRWTGHRYLMDTIVPGGVAQTADLDASVREDLLEQIDHVAREVLTLQKLYDDHAGLQDRFQNTGAITAQLAQDLSLTGPSARACGLALDSRCARSAYVPCAPYDRLAVQIACAETGDVAARVAVRFAEIFESLRIVRVLLADLPAGAHHEPWKAQAGEGLGLIEGWRGEVAVFVRCDAHGHLLRVHPHDPSWQAWPALEQAVINDIVPDFPLINKSFNLAYAGHDL
jgi:Ni,Fe-hydrogenase III large subunit